MAMVLNEEQFLLTKTARGFFKDFAPVAQLRALRDENSEDCFSRALWAKMSEMGFSGIVLPEAFGGLDYGLMGAGIIFGAMGRTLVSSPMLSTAIMGATLISKGASQTHKENILPNIVSGKVLIAFACDEANHSGTGTISLKATKTEDGYSLNGNKAFVLDGMVADYIIVAARTSATSDDKDGITLFLLKGDSVGVFCKRQILVDGRGAANINFEGVKVKKSDIVGELNEGGILMNQVLNIANLCLCAELLGLSESVFLQTLEYLKNRKQFGVAIGSFQSLQHRASELFSEIELGKSVLLSGLNAAEQGLDDLNYHTSLSKVKISEIGRLATNEAVQMHGGMGMTDEFDMGFYMKRARAIMLTFGDPSFHLDRFAKIRGY